MRIQDNKRRQKVKLKQRSRAYAALAMVAVLGVTALLGLLAVFRQGMRSHEAQVTNQIKVDYRQKEDALLRALVAIVPNKAIGAMSDGSSGSTNFGWQQIFTEAIVAARADSALDLSTVTGVTNVRSANTGDIGSLVPNDFVSVIAGTGSLVGEGITQNAGLGASSVNSKLPDFLTFANNNAASAAGPIITREKGYATPSQALFPDYNMIAYPDIRFGYVNQTGQFIAKRNWWAFSMTFGSGINISNSKGNGTKAVTTVTKNYILSIYEVPSQLAVSAGAKLSLEGGAWANASTTIDGGIFGTEVAASGLKLTGGAASISARREVNLGAGATIGTTTLNNGFDALGTREARAMNASQTDYSSTSDAYGASNAGNSGRVAILPLSQGASFIRRAPAMTNTLSTTTWDTYAQGSRQCAMGIEILTMAGGGVNKPTLVRFHYIDSAGSNASVVFEPYSLAENYPGDKNWARDSAGLGTTAGITNLGWENHNRDRFLWDHDDDDDDGNGKDALGNDATERTSSIIPFYWENLATDPDVTLRKPVLAIKLERFPEFLAYLGAAPAGSTVAGTVVNNSLAVWSNPADATVTVPSIPSNSDEMGVVIRDAENLAFCDADGGNFDIYAGRAGFTKGFSLVTDHRVYLVGVINNQTMTPPTGSGLAAPYYPPVSIFAAEKVFGTSAVAMGSVTVIGQLNSLQEDDGSTVDPLALKSGVNGGAVGAGSITANLSQIVNPAQLPPVRKMSWLVVVEEVH